MARAWSDARLLFVYPKAHSGPMDADHDLPLLAAQEQPAQRPDWESLFGDGVLPALLLGAERRLDGAR